MLTIYTYKTNKEHTQKYVYFLNQIMQSRLPKHISSNEDIVNRSEYMAYNDLYINISNRVA